MSEIAKHRVRTKSVTAEKAITTEIKPESVSGVRGLQVTKQVLFEEWEPLQKYTKVVFVYNPSPRTQRFLYEVPKSSVFSLGLPKPVKLSPRKGVKLTVHFKPTEAKHYTDKLIIRTAENEKILVKLRATTNIAMLIGPHEVIFGMCGVSQTIHKSFVLENNDDKEIKFNWIVAEPFLIEPMTSQVGPHKKITIKATFSPEKASVYTCEARCKTLHDNQSLTIKFSAKGVYPYLGIQSDQPYHVPHEYRLSFGTVNVNSRGTQEITLINPLPVKTQFSVARSPMYNVSSDSPFTFSQISATIEPLSKYVLKALYQPLVPSSDDSDVWIILIHGGFSSKMIHLSGTSSGPEVTLSTKCIDFTETEKGTVVEKSLKVTNSSGVATTFQFDVDCGESVFNFDPDLGQLPKESTVVIRVQFRPPYPITYYRRVATLIHMHEPIYLDLIGTAISSEVQPERLQPIHLDTFWLQIRKGQFFFIDDQSILPPAIPKPRPRAMDEYLYDGYYSEFTVISPPISIDQHVIDFGKCSLNYVPTKVFSVTNHTLFVMTITWMGGPSHVFSVKPLIVDIQPHRAGVFHVTFKPTVGNQVYWGELEAFAHCTGGGTASLNPGDYPWAPWCLTFKVQGHTHTDGNIYRANYRLSNRRIQLPAVPVRSHAARTVLITNQTPTTKIIYNMTTTTDGLVIKPIQGVVHDKFTTVTMGLAPRVPGPYTACVLLETNLDQFSKQELIVEGVASQPLLVLDNPTGLYFKPTCVGMTTKRLQMAHNISPILVHFTWTLKSIYGSLLSVEPNEGTILSNGVQYFKWSFCPKKKKRYLFSATLIADSEGTFGVRTYAQQEITIIGEGASVCVKAEPPELDIGALVVGTLKIVKLIIHNLSYCDLNIKLNVQKNTKEVSVNCGGQEDNTRPCLMFDDNANSVTGLGVHLPARCYHAVLLRVLPRQHGFYSYTLYYTLLADAAQEDSFLSIPVQLSNISMLGAHPTLQVVDVRFLGCAMRIRRQRAWQFLSIKKLNMCLESEPMFDSRSMEIDESLFPLLDSMHPVPKSVKQIYFHLPPAPVGLSPCTVILLLTNPGLVDTNWTIWYPWEQKVDAEIWAHTGHYLKSEVDEGRMKDDKLVQIEPRKGKLLPGALQFVSIVYVNQYCSHNLFPVRLSCHGGVEVLINIIGDTFEEDVPRIYFPYLIHEFDPIPLGSSEGTVVSYIVNNFSALPLKMRLDVLTLKRLQKQHYNHPVMDCLTRRLVIPHREFVALLWQIWPLEAKVYQVEIPLKFEHDTRLHTVTLLAPASATPEPAPLTEKTKMILPFQHVVLSHDRISFGHVPVCCRLTRMFFMTNVSNTPVKFEWIMPYKLLRQRIVFEPKVGRISPRSSVMCQLSLVTGHTPAIYEIQGYAEITSIKSSQSTTKPKLHNRLSTQLNLSTNIGQQTQKLAILDGVLVGDTSTPFLIHLEMRARTYLLQDYSRLFPENVSRYLIQRPRVRPQKDERPSLKRPSADGIEFEIKDVIYETMTTLLYDALNEPDFFDTIQLIGKDPIPYYCQIPKTVESRRQSPINMSDEDSSPTAIDIKQHPFPSEDSFDHLYWTHTKVFGRQKSVVSKTPTSDIFNDVYVPEEMKTFPESITTLGKVLDDLIWSILEDAEKGDFNITTRPRRPSEHVW